MTMEDMVTRLGFLVPERNVTCEVEFPQYLSPGITAHFSRLPRPEAALKAESLVRMMESVDTQSELLTKIDVRVIMAACTSGTFLGGQRQQTISARASFRRPAFLVIRPLQQLRTRSAL